MFTLHIHLFPKGPLPMDGLAVLLQDSVHHGASIGFAAPLSDATARSYWQETLATLANGEMALLVATDEEGRVTGSVQLARCPKENGRHRAEIRKLMVHTSCRCSGLGGALMARLEELAREWGLSLLVLDTAEGEPAEDFYRKRGYVEAGIIPNYATYPDGSMTGTVFFYKQL